MGVIGYSGAGKSTLVRMINGLDTPTSGELLLDGVDVVSMSERELRTLRRNIGMIFQQFNLFNSRSAAGNIEYPLKLAGKGKAEPKLRTLRRNIGMIFQQFNLFNSRSAAGNIKYLLKRAGKRKAERKQRVSELLDFVGLADRGKNYPEQLSGGQKQRVGIARALATNPTLLLADEATSALDPETTQEVLALLRKVNQELGITIVVITHEMDVIRSIADKVAVMENGRVVEYGSVYEVFSAPQTRVAQRFVASSLRNTPDQVETASLQADGGRLFTIDLTEDSGFFDAASALKANGGSISIVHGGVTTLQEHSFGKMTVRVGGPNAAVENFYTTLQKSTDIQEIVR
ncbi:methionine ABC transporter ATP-binding protein [Corynebacterium cystitidis]|uniref:D-methionine transport system ATP-binding protein n=1 Tax=Corynebacterium cystitidis DSM 20524 TaxID=1121357 RepID=A0A1H9QWC6_9CORY|nr:methionine ABC transporter ATP-binding protein [Corynebacterium cystitidis]WJY81635.1 Methionine import ATP-binding protein MetN 2 [Corynebacterium cystitidis DSM 20524]SER64730.1 D-methionine transport system ATP-binding protein [Corynebacterium cystitidis DSM 20524]SNV85462.1 ABC transporter ATP-binding protein [Corynebacterium cystitidis]